MDEPGPPEVDALLADLARWSAEQRTDAAVRSRAQEQWLRRQATEEARVVGVARDLAERGLPVHVRVQGGRAYHGAIAAVGQDFLVVRAAGRPPAFVRLDAVSYLRPPPGLPTGDAASARGPAIAATLAHVLVGLAGDRPRVLLHLRGDADAVAGELRAAGVDVLTLRVDGSPPGTVYVPAAAVTELHLLG